MISSNDTPTSIETHSSEAPHGFIRKFLSKWSDWQCLWPRRYVIAFMLFLLLLIRVWGYVNVLVMVNHVLTLGDYAHLRYPSIGQWKYDEANRFIIASSVFAILAQVPGAMLIFRSSSHKYILVSTIAASILDMLTPKAIQHHSAGLLTLLFSQTIITAPIKIAVYSMWKNWAPPFERTKLITFSFFGLLIGSVVLTFPPYFFHYLTSNESFYYSGTAGLIWALFWYNVTSDTPQSDQLISQKERQYLEGSIPTDVEQKIKLKDVPWKSILTSKGVLVLCFIFFKMGCSVMVIMTCQGYFGFYLKSTPLPVIIPFLFAFITITPSSAVLADALIKKFSVRTLLIRKCFLCGGFLLQCLFIMGINSKALLTKFIFYMISYLCFVASLPGFITIGVDLSPRYVTIIAGFMFTFYTIGFALADYFVNEIVSDIHSLSWAFLLDGVLTFIAAVLFAKWGDIEEQAWSLTFPTNCCKSYPKPDDEEDVNLVPESV